MRTIDEAIYGRISNDGILVGLIGTTDRMGHAMEGEVGEAPALTYSKVTSAQNLSLQGDSIDAQDQIYQFNIFSDRYPDIVNRLWKLFHNNTFAASSEASQIRSVFDWEGPDLFDEALAVPMKNMRFKFFVVPVATAPI